MEFFIQDPNVLRLPPEDVRILDLRAQPYPDNRRVRVALDLTPFRERPYIELTLVNAQEELLGSASIVEPVAWKLELTMHLRQGGAASGPLTLVARLSYPDLDEVDSRQVSFALGEK